MRTVFEIRQDMNLNIPTNSDSIYKPIERSDRKFLPVKVPNNLVKDLPFSSKPKATKKTIKENEYIYNYYSPGAIPESLIISTKEKKKYF